MRWLLAVALVPLAASGCFEPCPYTMAGWTDRTVYDAMYIHEVQWRGDEGWTIADAGLDARWGQHALVWVELAPPGRADGLRMAAGFAGGLHVANAQSSIRVTAEGDGAAIGAELDRFLALLAPSTEAATQVRTELERERVPVHEACPERQPCRKNGMSVHMEALLPPGWGAQRAWDALSGASAGEELPFYPDGNGFHPPGQAILGREGWTFHFQLPVRWDANGFEADPEGHVQLHLWQAKARAADVFRDNVRAYVAGFGLPPPEGDFPVQRDICGI